MADSLELLQAKVHTRISSLRKSIDELSPGRGAQLGPLLSHKIDGLVVAVSALERDVTAAKSITEPALADQLLVNVSKRFERISPQLDIVHYVLATFGESIGRSDVPVGFQHLIDLLMEQVVPRPGDPIVHLDPQNMYSTADIELQIEGLFSRVGSPGTGRTFTGNRPIAFNLPALDPANALLSPVLAHEVAHTAVAQKLLSDLLAIIDTNYLDGLLQTAIAESGNVLDASALGQQFQSWCNELISDAVALVLTGPSFLWAFTTFAPPSDFAIVGTHPAERDRLRFHLALLDRLNWTGFMRDEFPQLSAWFDAVANAPVLAGTPQETFLRAAMLHIQDQIAQLAIDHVGQSALDPDCTTRANEAVSWFQDGVPVVEWDGAILSPWEVVLFGWVASLRFHGDGPGSLPAGAGDSGFNALLVKALELSSIVTSWRDHERASP